MTTYAVKVAADLEHGDVIRLSSGHHFRVTDNWTNKYQSCIGGRMIELDTEDELVMAPDLEVKIVFPRVRLMTAEEWPGFWRLATGVPWSG